jgi:hypothetical protein
MNDAEIMQAVQHAIDSLRRELPPLDFHIVHERSTAHRLAVHLEPHFAGWNLDCEYDRFGKLQKLLESFNTVNNMELNTTCLSSKSRKLMCGMTATLRNYD